MTIIMMVTGEKIYIFVRVGHIPVVISLVCLVIHLVLLLIVKIIVVLKTIVRYEKVF